MTDNAQDQSRIARKVGRVVVVGAGFAGLSAATELARAGCSVTLLERGVAAGGRCGGEQEDGFSIEQQLPLLYSSDRRLASWIRDLGLAQTLLPPRPVQIAQLSRGGVLPIVDASPRSVARIPGIKWREALRLIRLPRLMNRYRALLDLEAPELAADLDYRSAADFGRLYFGQTVVDRFISPAVWNHCDAEELSRATWLLDWLARGEGSGRTLLLRGGLESVANAAAHSAGVRLRKSVNRIEDNGRGGMAVHISGDDGDALLDAKTVVLATDAASAAEIAAPVLTLAESDALREFRTGPEITLSIALERELTGIPQFIQVPRGERSSIRALLLDPGGPGLRAPLGAGLATVSASPEFCREYALAASDVVEKALLAEFERIYPRAVGRARFVRAMRGANSLPQFGVGTHRVLRRFARVQQDRRALGRRLYFAGDFLMGPRPEHAVASGMRAAREILSDRAGS